MKIGIPPDELTHIRFIEYYRDHSLSPFITDQSSGFAIGDVTREVSYLYHYLMSLLLRILPFSALNEYIILRFVGIGLSLLTLLISVKTMKLLRVPEAITTFGLLVVANFSEFLLMSSAVNNDNAVWLLSALGFYFSVQLWQQKEKAIRPFLFLALVIAFGAIVKKTFLPLALVFSIVELAYLWWQRQNLLVMIKKLKLQEYLIIAMILVGVGLTIERIGVNILSYGHIDVVCDQVHDVGQCLEFGVYRRNYNLPLGDNLGIIPLYLFVPAWLYDTWSTIFGTQSWVGTSRPPFLVGVLLVGIFVLSIVSAILKRKEFGKHSLPMFFIFLVGLAYFVVNLIFNFNLYEKRGLYSLALQGRYVFPVLPLFVMLSTAYIASLFKKQQQALLGFGLIFVVLLFASSSISGVVRSSGVINNPLQPVLIFNRENAISKFEPSI